MSENYRSEMDHQNRYLSRDYQNQYYTTSKPVNDQRPQQDSYLSPNNFESSQTHFVPKVVQSGYIIGPPVAYTQQPTLPSNFQPFSPRKSNILIGEGIQSRDLSPVGSRIIYSPNPKVSISQLPNNSHILQQPIQTETRYIVNQPPQTQFQSQPQLQQQPIKTIIHQQQPQPQQIIQETVSRIQYDRCVSECKNWETKYNELYLKYMNATSNPPQNAEVEGLKQQNYRLQQRVKQLQNKQRQFYQKLQDHYSSLVQKYKESTMKECMLLVDRYRLQCKQNDR